jgi:regulator of protease activity HflC (stomatin/prohibitin superfamily)
MVAANEYMQQVMAEQAEVEEGLRKGRARKAMRLSSDSSRDMNAPARVGPDEAPAVDVRVTGFWRWKNVIVPPNAYVVHTRRGRSVPLHCGLGTSFRFNPVTDSYMVVPAAMQTIVINANCICSEKQGILVQGYVQWVIDEFETAYRKLDFSDPVDPMGVVNIQLREQAEAVIKDTVATMTLENVLSDRQPIIKELTTRLRSIMEGDGEEEGLGLRIVTVQIKEAVVSSSTLWETLQRPFRAERRKEARLAELTQEEKIREREAEDEKAAELLAIETAGQIAERRAAAEAEAFDRAKAEEVRRTKLEAESLAEAIEAEKDKAAKQAELTRLQLENEIAAERLRFTADNERALATIETDAARRRVDNDLSPELLKQKLIEMMPELAERMPTPSEMKSVSINGVDGLSGLLPAMLELLGKVEVKNEAA